MAEAVTADTAAEDEAVVHTEEVVMAAMPVDEVEAAAVVVMEEAQATDLEAPSLEELTDISAPRIDQVWSSWTANNFKRHTFCSLFYIISCA